MKKSLSIVFGVLVCVALLITPIVLGGGCINRKKIEGPAQEVEFLEKDKKYYEYSLESYLIPFWQGQVSINESVSFFGENSSVKLLYRPVQILSVRSYDLSEEYFEGEDFYVDGQNLVLTKDTRIRYWTEDEYFLTSDENGAKPSTKFGRPYIAHDGRGTGIVSRQLNVSYTHAESDEYYVAPTVKDKEKLKQAFLKPGAKVLFFGDSIVAGAGASGYYGLEPNMPSWADMVMSYLKANLNSTLTSRNAAVGAKTSGWGVKAIDGAMEDDDIVIVGFGMNDPYLFPVMYRNNIEKIIKKIRSKSRDAYIILIAPMLANRWSDYYHGFQYGFEKELNKLAKEYSDVAVINMTSTYEKIIEVKAFYEISHNNVNHPNDYFVRLYAQQLLNGIIG